VEAVAVACEQAAPAGEVRCEQAALVAAMRCGQVASTGVVQSQETALRILGLSRESRIQLQIGPTSAGLMPVCLADLATDLAGVAAGAEIIGADMVGVWVQRQ
jgi:hypothetical protein